MSDLERRTAEEDRASHLRFLESLDLVNRAMQGTSDLERMLSDVLDVVVAVFGCDRAWLIYPCDPATASYQTVSSKPIEISVAANGAAPAPSAANEQSAHA